MGNEAKGVCTGLYGRMLPALERLGYPTATARIALRNPASITLHERFGFKKVAHLSEVGFKMQRWVDVGYWQLFWNDVMFHRCTSRDESASMQQSSANEFFRDAKKSKCMQVHVIWVFAIHIAQLPLWIDF